MKTTLKLNLLHTLVFAALLFETLATAQTIVQLKASTGQVVYPQQESYNCISFLPPLKCPASFEEIATNNSTEVVTMYNTSYGYVLANCVTYTTCYLPPI